MSKAILSGALHRAAFIVVCVLTAGCSVYGPASLPKPKPTGPTGLVVSPNALSMGPGDEASVSASESGYNGTFASTDTCGGIATVVAMGSSQFGVTAVAPGLCSVTISDSSSNSAKVDVSVQTTIIGGQ
jgi:hypothetical protein